MKRVCLITGAGGRLGLALCGALADEYDIIATYRSTLPAISSQVRWRVESGNGAARVPPRPIYCVQADLSRREDIRRLVEVALARFGRVDAVVNSAADVKFHGKTIELWEMNDYASAQLLTNCVAPLQLVSAIHQQCWKDDQDENVRWRRNVVNVSSASGLHAYADSNQAFYSASKAALNILTLHQAVELAPYSVRANAVCPRRFSDQPSTLRVVQAIRELLDGSSTGTIVSHFPPLHGPDQAAGTVENSAG